MGKIIMIVAWIIAIIFIFHVRGIEDFYRKELPENVQKLLYTYEAAIIIEFVVILSMIAIYFHLGD